MVRLIGVKALAIAMSIDFIVVARAQRASVLTLLELFLADYQSNS